MFLFHEIVRRPSRIVCQVADDRTDDVAEASTYVTPRIGDIGILELVAGVLGNLLVLLSVWRYRPLRRVINLFVASLAVCNLVQTLAIRTINIQTYVVGHWTLGTRTCAYALVVSNLVILEDTARFLMKNFCCSISAIEKREFVLKLPDAQQGH